MLKLTPTEGDALLTEHIRAIHAASDCADGSPNIHVELRCAIKARGSAASEEQ
jgi:hypothetical protein